LSDPAECNTCADSYHPPNVAVSIRITMNYS